MKLILSFGNRTKKVNCEQSLDTIKIYAQEKFDIKGEFHLQYFDIDVQEWIDLEEDNMEEISNPDSYHKVRVVAAFSNVIIIDESGTQNPESKADDSYDQLPSLSNPVDYRSSTPTNPRSCTPSSIMSDESWTSETGRSKIPMNSALEAGGKSTSKKKLSNSFEDARKLKIWPKEYQVPKHTFSQTTLRKLAQQDKLDSKEKKDIMSGIYTDVTMYEGGLYPTGERYNLIIDSLLREYPYLAHGEGVALQSARNLSKERLVHKFQNSRKRQDSSLPEVKANKKTKTEASQQCEGPLTWGLQNYLPDMPLTEDDASVSRHIEWLKKKFKKKDGQDILQVDMLMNLTLYHRRDLVVRQQKDVETILIEYPWLRSCEQLIKEFIRLGPSIADVDVKRAFSKNLDKYSDAIIKLTKSRKGGKKAEEVLDRRAVMRNQSERKAATRCAAIISLPLLFRENIDNILMSEDEAAQCEEPQRIIILKEGYVLSKKLSCFKVTVENVIVCRVNDLLSAIIGLLMAIYAFNLAYPKKFEKTLSFCQRVLLSLDDEAPIDKKILNVTSMLNQELN